MARDINHATEAQHGGRARRSDRLYVLQTVSDPREHVDVVITASVPATRADCPTSRPCGHVRCEHNLSFVEREARPGNRQRGGGPLSATLEFVVGETNCELDLSSQERDSRAIAKVLGTSQRRVQQIIKSALRKLGVHEDEIKELLRADGDDKLGGRARAGSRWRP